MTAVERNRFLFIVLLRMKETGGGGKASFKSHNEQELLHECRKAQVKMIGIK